MDEHRRSKRVAIVCNKYEYIYIFRRKLIDRLVKEGYELILVAGKDKYLLRFQETYDCDYRPINLKASSTNPLMELITFWSLFNQLRASKPDVVLNFTIKANIYSAFSCRRLKIPAINNVTGFGTAFFSGNIILRKVSKFLIRFSFKSVRRVYVQNSDDERDLIDSGLVDSRLITRIPGSGVDVDKFKSLTPYVKESPFRFLMISRVIRDKGIIEYFDAARIVKNQLKTAVEFHLIGDLLAENKTKVSAEEFDGLMAGGNVIYHGVKEDIPAQIEKVQCVVLPSYREGLPRVILEAMSMSKPVIVTDVPGCREIVKDGINGKLCEPRNSESLAEKLFFIFHSSEKELISFGTNGRKLVESSYQERVVLDQYLKDIQYLWN